MPIEGSWTKTLRNERHAQVTWLKESNWELLQLWIDFPEQERLQEELRSVPMGGCHMADIVHIALKWRTLTGIIPEESFLRNPYSKLNIATLPEPAADATIPVAPKKTEMQQKLFAEFYQITSN